MHGDAQVHSLVQEKMEGISIEVRYFLVGYFLVGDFGWILFGWV